MACKNCSPTHDHSHDHGHDHNHEMDTAGFWSEMKIPLIAFGFLAVGIVLEHINFFLFQQEWIKILWFFFPFYWTAIPVIRQAWALALKKDFFNELSLMSIATIGACLLGEYAEGVGVMIFYTVGETVQSYAVSRVRGDIKSLIELKINEVRKIENNQINIVEPESVKIGDMIEVLVGEKVPLDGILLSKNTFFNTSALTGESVPREILENGEVLAGMVPSQESIHIQVSRLFEDSALSKILHMVESASERKSPVEQFIRRFARVYTPIVFALAVLLVIVPAFFVADYQWVVWFKRSLTFLVISCPCALVISVPLGFFGGIGVSSRHGLLFKGGNYLDAITHMKTLVMDKTGTMTKGVFTVQEIITENKNEFIKILAMLEQKSNHPIAQAIMSYVDEQNIAVDEISTISEIAGKGLSAEWQGATYLAGNKALLQDYRISIPQEFDSSYSVVYLAKNQEFMGAVLLSDEIKEDAFKAIQDLKKYKIKTIMLSGDKDSIVQKVAKDLGIDKAYGDLLPQDKLHLFEQIKQDQQKGKIAFVGDGINDAPTLAMSDIGIAMGALGSDIAVETADLVIQTDEPSKIPLAIKIAKKTRQIVFQNIFLAFTVKFIVLILGANGLASMWEAIFADVGVSLIATFNAFRLLLIKFKN